MLKLNWTVHYIVLAKWDEPILYTLGAYTHFSTAHGVPCIFGILSDLE
jgi:hypothetical protein